jgi:hypothetical protein
MSDSRSQTIGNVLRTSGVVLFLFMVASWLATFTGHYHTLQREAGITVGNLDAWLEIAWICIAGMFAITHWRSASGFFRVVFILNSGIVAMLLFELFSAAF